MEDKPKSILDNIPVDDKAFPLTTGTGRVRGKMVLELVGNCTICGNPIYGQKMVNREDTPELKHSCTCNRDSRLR